MFEHTIYYNMLYSLHFVATTFNFVELTCYPYTVIVLMRYSQKQLRLLGFVTC